MVIIGSDNIWSIEHFYIRYLRENGVDTYLFEAQNRFVKYYGRSVFNKIIFRLGLSSFYTKMNKDLIQYIDKLDPDVIFVFKGMEVLPVTLEYFKSKNILVINYNPDNPFIFTGPGSGNKNVTRSIGLYDLHFTYNLDVEERITKQFAIPVEILPFGFEIPDEVYAMAEQQPEILKACFVGNPDKARAAFLNEVAQHVEIDIYGEGWERYITSKNVTIRPAVYGNEFWMILRQYRVQLNLMRIHNLYSHNMRTFEIPGIGGIMLAPLTREHELFFKEGEQVFFYKDAGECVEKIKYILALPERDSDTIRQNAREVSLTNGYTYERRTLHVIDVINRYLNKRQQTVLHQ